MKQRHAVVTALFLSIVCTAAVARAVDIPFRSFSASATMGPQADAFAAKLTTLTATALGAANAVHFVALAGPPPVPPQFGGSILAAVGAGAAHGGFDAAYISGTDLNGAWGFIYNSGVPFGPRFDEFTGFLYGHGAGQSGLELLQSLFDARGKNVVALPIVASSEQLSGYFLQPLGDNDGHERGVGLVGLCQQPWTLRYLPPAQWVIDKACDTLVAEHRIAVKNLRFIAAIPGNGSLVDAVKSGRLQGFEFATPLDDLSQLFVGGENPGTVGVRFVHVPGWHQPFLVTWMIVNKDVWNALSPAQQALTTSTARDHVLSSYGESMSRQGAALRQLLETNRHDGHRGDEMVLSEWPERDQDRLSAATNEVLNARVSDPALSPDDRHDYGVVLEALRQYVRANWRYWMIRAPHRETRLDRWTTPSGERWLDDERR